MLGNKISGTVNKKGVFIFKKPMLGKTLTVIQLVLSLFFIITSTLLYLQLRHFAHAEYGFGKENIINVNLRGNDHEQFANEFASWSDIKEISASSIMPATMVREGDRIYKLDESQDSLYVDHISIDQNFIKNLDFEIIAGNDFNQELTEENKRFIIVNESTALKFGYENINDIVGEKFSTVGSNNVEGKATDIVEVIGIVKNFHYDIFQDQIGHLNIKVSGQNLIETAAFLEDKWKELDKIHTFQYQFFDEQLADSQGIFSDVLSIVGFVSLIAIAIAGMGLLGLATYSAETKIKEIGIRKVLGASVRGILMQISKGYIYLLLIAIVIATPIAYFLNNSWLQFFAIRINFSIWILVFGVLILLTLGLLAIGSQTLKAAMTNPANTLRDE
jgi:putative ABC transport system permease protein